MSELGIVIVIGETSVNQDLGNLLSHIKDGIASTLHFDSLNVNKLLSSVNGPESLSDHGVKFSSAGVNIVVLPNATVERVLNEVANAFNSLPKEVLLVFSGLICQSTANWILSDGVLKPEYVADRISAAALKMQQTLADTTLEWMPPMSFHVACTSVPYGGDWRRVLFTRLPASIAGHPLFSSVNRLHASIKKPVPGAAVSAKPELAPLPADISGVETFCQRLESVIELPTEPHSACQPVSKANDCSIRIRRPCLYIFPEGSGQSSIFALPGFTFMVNAGASRDPKCWKLAQHFESIDTILHTHWGVENCLGLSSLLPALVATNGYASGQSRTTIVLTTPPAHAITHPLSPEASTSSDPLVVNVAAVANELAQAVKPFVADDKLFVQEVTRGGKITTTPKPICLYYKVGFGSLDFYPLTPTEEDQAEVKKLAALWAKAAPNVVSALAEAPKGTSTIKQTAQSLVSQLSVSGLLIWKSHQKGDRSVRILFVAPNAHQLRVLAALEALHLGLPCIRSADPEATFSNATSTGNGLGGMRKLGSAAPVGKSTTRPPATTKPAAPTTRVPSATSRLTSTRNATTASAAHTTTAAKLTKPAPKTKEPVKSTESKTKTLKREPPKEVPKAAGKAENKKHEVAEMKQIDTPESAPIQPSEIPQTPLGELSPEGNPVSPNPEVSGDLNGGDDVNQYIVSPVKSPLKEEESTVNDDQHIPTEEPEVEEVPLTTPAESLNPLADWGQPQEMPAPVAKNAKPASVTKAAPVAQSPPEGYYEASAGATKGLIDKLVKHTFVDVAFLPGGGDTYLVDAEFFKRVSAQYYIATTAAPTADLLKAMLVGKTASNGDNTESGNRVVSLILARDSPGLLEWAALNEKRLVDAKIDLLTVAERSTIQVVTTEGAENGNISCPGFRLDF